MSDKMTFPDTVEEFMEQYKIVDTEQVYTNGVELVPIFRMKQWFEHLPSVQPESCEGCIQYGLWENEIEYGYPSPCTRCKRRANDNYER